MLLAALTLAACGEKPEEVKGKPQPFDLALDFYPNPDHVGIYMAKRLGYFRDAGLDVWIHAPSDPSAPIKQVAAGQVDLAISYEPEILLARDQGLDVTAVGALVDRPLTSMIWLKDSGVAGSRPARQDDRHGRHPLPGRLPEDDPRPGEHVPHRGQVRQRRLGLLPAILGGRAHAILGGFSNIEGVDLRVRGQQPDGDPGGQARRAALRRAGAGRAGRARLARTREPIRLFIAALARGTAAAVTQPGGGDEGGAGDDRDLDPKPTKRRGQRDPAAA